VVPKGTEVWPMSAEASRREGRLDLCVSVLGPTLLPGPTLVDKDGRSWLQQTRRHQLRVVTKGESGSVLRPARSRTLLPRSGWSGGEVRDVAVPGSYGDVGSASPWSVEKGEDHPVGGDGDLVFVQCAAHQHGHGVRGGLQGQSAC